MRHLATDQRHNLIIIETRWVYPPIPIRDYDWTAVTSNYDGAEDSSSRGQIGYGPTEKEAIADLLENNEDLS